ncbi:complement C1q-like protein 4 [Saccostrea echinata]|uniref:complement C1q-like protein 4 n=1 Tax=Saccostrea echinata TaxID=191078 RepID=UPI002A81C131|nr:complement C1q-like protein 4 [Saccostrea echinata]
MEMKVERLMEIIEIQRLTFDSKMKNLEEEIIKKATSPKFCNENTTNNADNHSNQEFKHRVRRFLTGLSPIAFYAYISKSFTHVGDLQTHIYDVVVTNLGNGYSKHSGAFTAPRSGVYGFSWTVFASGRHMSGDSGSELGEITSQLLQNGHVKGTIHADTEASYDDEMSTGFVILSVNAGDVIMTRATTLHQGSYLSDGNGRWTFSGFQIA